MAQARLLLAQLQTILTAGADGFWPVMRMQSLLLPAFFLVEFHGLHPVSGAKIM